MKNHKAFVFLGYPTFPYGFAEVQKIILISKSLLLSGNEVTVISRNGYEEIEKNPDFTPQGTFEGIKYIYASGSCFRSNDFLKRRINKIKGITHEFLTLRKMKKRGALDFAILSTRSFFAVTYYKFLSKLLGFRIILNYVEYYTAIKKGKNQIAKKYNDYLFDNYAPVLSDAVLPISEFLINHLKKVAPKKLYLKIPGLTDFNKYQGIQKDHHEKYFMFCGDATYKEIVLFIIDSFELLGNQHPFFLYLVIGGRPENVAEIEDYISKQSVKDRIKKFSYLPERELYTLYRNATALLIPLRPTFQDSARFPHKTGEYLASGNPVISTKYGEINLYFTDMKDMFLADKYDRSQFSGKMQYVIDHPDKAIEIGLRGKEKASQLFDYQNIAETLNNFFSSQFYFTEDR